MKNQTRLFAFDKIYKATFYRNYREKLVRSNLLAKNYTELFAFPEQLKMQLVEKGQIPTAFLEKSKSGTKILWVIML